MNDKKKIYLIGRRGDRTAKEMKEEFDKVQTRLVQMGYLVCNPTRQFTTNDRSMTIIRNLILLSTCDEVALIPGWENGHVSAIEKLFAELTGKKFFELKY